MLFKFGADWAVFSGADAGAGSVISGTGTVASDMGSAAFSSGLVLTSGREIGGSLDARLERTRGLSQSAASATAGADSAFKAVMVVWARG